jgi:hypothetical protein
MQKLRWIISKQQKNMPSIIFTSVVTLHLEGRGIVFVPYLTVADLEKKNMVNFMHDNNTIKVLFPSKLG